jgi:hypothetical protein
VADGCGAARRGAAYLVLDGVEQGDAAQHLGCDRRVVGQLVELAAHVRPAEGEADLLATPGERGIAAIAIDLQDAGEVAEMRFGRSPLRSAA